MPQRRNANPETLSPPLSSTRPCHSTGLRSVILDPENIDISPMAALTTAQTVVIRAARSTALRAESWSLIVGQTRSVQSGLHMTVSLYERELRHTGTV
jgi:hypothetical protein